MTFGRREKSDSKYLNDFVFRELESLTGHAGKWPQLGMFVSVADTVTPRTLMHASAIGT
jgi:hypothetical protein